MESTETRHADEWRREMTGTITLSFIELSAIFALCAGFCLIAFIFGARRGSNEIRRQRERGNALESECGRLTAKLEESIDARFKEQFDVGK